MESIQLFTAIFALVFVLGLIWLVQIILRRYGPERWLTQKYKQDGKRLSILEVQPLDAKRKLVIVQCDQKEYLLLLGDGHEVVVDNLPAGKGKAK